MFLAKYLEYLEYPSRYFAFVFNSLLNLGNHLLRHLCNNFL